MCVQSACEHINTFKNHCRFTDPLSFERPSNNAISRVESRTVFYDLTFSLHLIKVGRLLRVLISRNCLKFRFYFLRYSQVSASNWQARLRKEGIKITDKRIRMMNEIITCVKLIKMYAWEASFAKTIGKYVLIIHPICYMFNYIKLCLPTTSQCLLLS